MTIVIWVRVNRKSDAGHSGGFKPKFTDVLVFELCTFELIFFHHNNLKFC